TEAADEDDLDREAREGLASAEFVEGADPELCDDVFGMDDDSVTSLFFAMDGTVERLDATLARLGELAAGAPAEVADLLVTTAEALERAAAAESQEQRDQAGVDHEAAYLAIGDYCFGLED